MTIIGLVLTLLFLGFLSWFVGSVPFIDEPMKGVIKWILIVVMAVVVFSFAFHWLGVGFPRTLY